MPVCCATDACHPASYTPADGLEPALRALARAWEWRRKLETGEANTISDLAADAELADRHVSLQIRLANLAPAVIERTCLNKVDGFISVERFQSLTDPCKVLSLSFFADEAAVRQWRTLTAHRGAQIKGRGGVFANYRLRIASVVRDYGMFERAEAPSDSREVHTQ